MVVAALAFAIPREGSAFEWPVAPTVDAALDPIARFRWDRISAWSAPAHIEIRAALAALERAPETPRTHRARAVLLRLLGREGECAAALRLARTLAADDGAPDDPDVALTAAWLAARGGDFTQATTLGMRALARMPIAAPQTMAYRELLSLEIARWSMARGPDGLDDALAVLRAHVAISPASSMVLATMALCHARAGRHDEARTLAAPLRDTLVVDEDGAEQGVRGSVVQGEASAAVGVALALVGRARDALAPLQHACERVPVVWRAFQTQHLAAARRAPPGPSQIPRVPAHPTPRRVGADPAIDLFLQLRTLP